MKNLIKKMMLVLALVGSTALVATAQYVTIPDANFRAYLQQQYPSCFNGQGLMDTTVASAMVGTMSCSSLNIADMNGIQYFHAIDRLECQNNQLATLNVQGLANLYFLDCGTNQLTVLNVQGCTNLQYLYCYSSQLASLNVQGLTNLQQLDCHNNQLASFIVQGLINLHNLECSNNQLTSLNVQSLVNLQQLYCANNYLTSLNVQGLTSLQSLGCGYNQLTSLIAQGSTSLYDLDCSHNQFISLNVQGLTNLHNFDYSYNQLASLNVQGLINLRQLFCTNNQLTALSVQGLINLQQLYCNNNQLTTLNVQGLTNLQQLDCQNNQITALNVQSCTGLHFLDCNNNQLISLNVQGLPGLYNLSCGGNQLTSLNVQGLTQLDYLECTGNQLPSLDVQGLTNLQGLYCNNNQLTTLNVQGLTGLQSLSCGYNQLTTLNVQGLTNLQRLYADINQLTSLNVQGCTGLQDLSCSYNQLTTLNVQGCTSLRSLFCPHNLLITLNVQGINLWYLYCSYNQLTTLPVITLGAAYVSCNHNQITTITNFNHIDSLACQYNPVSCLPIIPNTLHTLLVDSTNVNCLPNHPTSLHAVSPATLPLCQTNNPNGCIATARIYGNVYRDNNANCTVESSDSVARNILVEAVDIATQTVYAGNSDAQGDYEITVPLGTFSLSVIAPNSYWAACPALTQTIVQSGQQAQRKLLFQPLVACADMAITHTATTVVRPCSTAVYRVNCLNRGTITAQGSYAELMLAPELSFVSCALPTTPLGNNRYRFAVGDVGSLAATNFEVTVMVSCTAVLGQQVCTEAEVFPHTYCSPPLLWDGSDLQLSGRCIGNNEVRFILHNGGTGAMSAPQTYRIIEDNVMIRAGQVQLPPNGSDSVTVTADPQRIYRIIANESANNPAGNTQETFLLWGCNGTNAQIHWGFVNQYPLNTGSDYLHQICTTVRTSLDPNDITAVAAGTQAQHFILNDNELEYTIRFQNTGNDTAFVVRILDRLPAELDKTTLQIGVASHPMTYQLHGNGVLEFLFTRIWLPDSTTNEAKSHGFVTYKIKIAPNLAAGTAIHNQAQIYFDANAPVATNIYTHTIATAENEVYLSAAQVIANQNFSVKIMPNPMHDATVFELTDNGLLTGTKATLTLYNALGQVQLSQNFVDTRLTLARNHLPQGCYFYKINNENGTIAQGKLIMD
jgi:uncharacterized repeat protein (TIGR01451 family)